MTVTATDPAGGVGLQTFAIDVARSNEAPRIESQPPFVTVLGRTYQYDVVARDTDGDTLNYDLVSAPSGMTVDREGRVHWQPAADQLGLHDAELRVRDGRGGESVQPFQVRVDADTQPPEVILYFRYRNAFDVVNAVLGRPVMGQLLASDNVGIVSLEATFDGQPLPLSDQAPLVCVRSEQARSS